MADTSQAQHAAPAPAPILVPALKVGVMTGAAGTFVGGLAGAARSRTPVLFAIASGLQCFALGGTFWGSRQFLLNSQSTQQVSSRDKIVASAISGSIAGASGGILRGRGHIIPGILVLGLAGAAGQKLVNMTETRKDAPTSKPWFTSSWSPMKSLSDAEYEDLLQEKLLRVNAEIALIEDHIKELKAKEASATLSSIQTQNNSSEAFNES